MSPRPPEYYDSEFDDSDLDDGFYCSTDYDDQGKRIKPKQSEVTVPIEFEVDRNLDHCATNGDVDEFRRIWQENYNILDVNKPFKTSGYTPLMLACQYQHVDLVEYLLFELNADPNANSNNMTALILATTGIMNIYSTSNEDEEARSFQICQWLIQRKAMVDKSNLRRETPLMHAAANGYVSVIDLLLTNKATLEACDNDEKTALFYAVNANRYEATKALIEAGALVDTEDRFHNTPKLLAQENGYDNLLELFPPDPIIEYIPSAFTCYETYKDLIPDAFPDKQTPAYCPDVYTMLYGMRASKVEYKFYEARISLPELLTITDERLCEIGIEFPYHRKRILLGLLKFHEKSWTKESLYIPKMNAQIQDYFNVLGNCLKQLIIIESTLKFVEHHPIFAAIHKTHESHHMRHEINRQLFEIRNNVQRLFHKFQKIDTLAPPPPLFICKDVITNALNKNNTFRAQLYRTIKVFGCIGLGIAVLAVIKSRAY